MTFAKHLRELMNDYNINATDLAKASGISRASISKFLKGYSKPSDTTLMKLAKGLGCNMQDLTVPEDDLNINEDKNVPIEIAAKLLGKSEQFVRIALQRGTAPFGFATQVSGNRYSYHISPKKLKEYQGVTA